MPLSSPNLSSPNPSSPKGEAGNGRGNKNAKLLTMNYEL